MTMMCAAVAAAAAGISAAAAGTATRETGATGMAVAPSALTAAQRWGDERRLSMDPLRSTATSQPNFVQTAGALRVTWAINFSGLRSSQHQYQHMMAALILSGPLATSPAYGASACHYIASKTRNQLVNVEMVDDTPPYRISAAQKKRKDIQSIDVL